MEASVLPNSPKYILPLMLKVGGIKKLRREEMFCSRKKIRLIKIHENLEGFYLLTDNTAIDHLSLLPRGASHVTIKPGNRNDLWCSHVNVCTW